MQPRRPEELAEMLRQAARRKREADQVRRDLIVEARTVMTLREVGEVAGISHARVHGIVNERH
jgi:hypothetical protein